MFNLIDNIMSIKDAEHHMSKMIMTFVRSNPVNSLTEIADSISKLRGTVSNETLLSQLDFVSNVGLEKERLMREKEEDAQFQLKYSMAFMSNNEEPKVTSDKAIEENKAEEDNNNYRGQRDIEGIERNHYAKTLTEYSASFTCLDNKKNTDIIGDGL